MCAEASIEDLERRRLIEARRQQMARQTTPPVFARVLQSDLAALQNEVRRQLPGLNVRLEDARHQAGLPAHPFDHLAGDGYESCHDIAL